MPFLSMIFSAIGGPIVDSVLKNVTGIFQAYFNKQITEAQLREQLSAALLASFKEVEVAYADSLSKTYASFMTTLAQSQKMQTAWCAAVYSQLFVLFYHQFCIPLIVLSVRSLSENTHWQYPSSGATVEWAYLLLAGLMGMAPAVMRAGPAAGNLLDRMKAVVGK